MQGTNVYWLVLDPSDHHTSKKASLEERGFKVVMFKTLSAMLDKVMTQRAGLYIVGDEGPEANVLKAITTLSSYPDLAGAKLILSISQNSSAILRAAASEGFRDILPLEIPDKEWTQRFLFSTATKTIELPSPTSLTTQDLDGQLFLPARLVTMNTAFVFVESRLSPKPGDRLRFTGPLIQALRQPHVELVVEDRKPPHLRYRFSDGFYASWSPADIFNSPSGLEVQQVIKSFGGASRARVFLAIQSPALRATLMRHLDQKYFDIHSALHKRSITEDPKFFAPHLVFIEERMCTHENLRRFAAMAPLLPEDSTIIVLGDETHKSALEGVAGGLRIVFLRQVPINLREVVEKNYLPASARESSSVGTYSIPSDHDFSMGELMVSCRMMASHPMMSRIAVPKQVETYSLARLAVPWLKKVLGKDPYVKIMQLRPGKNGQGAAEEVLADCYFCDVMPELRKRLARGTEPEPEDRGGDEPPQKMMTEDEAEPQKPENTTTETASNPIVQKEDAVINAPTSTAQAEAPQNLPLEQKKSWQMPRFSMQQWMILTVIVTIATTIFLLSTFTDP